MASKVTFYLPESLDDAWKKADAEQRTYIGYRVRSLMRVLLAREGKSASGSGAEPSGGVRGSQSPES